ncbi:MAG: hypothetical protein V4525_02260 [Pseudomonadota bacterium]
MKPISKERVIFLVFAITIGIGVGVFYAHAPRPKPYTTPQPGSELWCEHRSYTRNRGGPERVPGMKDIVAIFPVKGVTALNKEGLFSNWDYGAVCEHYYHRKTLKRRNLLPLLREEIIALR